MSGFRSLVLISIGAVVGWSAARYQGGVPQVTIGPTSASALASATASADTCTIPVAKPVDKPPVASASAPQPTVLEQLSTLKISELYKNCEEAEIKFLDSKLASYSKTLYEHPAPERDQLVGEWTRRFADLMKVGSYWRANFTQEFGPDIVQVDLLLDVRANTDENYRCMSTSVYYEINGKASADSFFATSACDGSGFRKKGDQFFYDVNLYSFPGIGKHITILLLPMPGGGGAEYLGGEAEKWVPISQFNWQKISLIEFSQLQQRFQQKVDQLGGP